MLSIETQKILTILEDKNEYTLALTPKGFDLESLTDEIYWQSQFGNHVFVFEDLSTERTIIFTVLADEDPTKWLQMLTKKLSFGTYSGFEINDPEDKITLAKYEIEPRRTVIDRAVADINVWPNLGNRPDKTKYPRNAANFTFPYFDSTIHSFAQ